MASLAFTSLRETIMPSEIIGEDLILHSIITNVYIDIDISYDKGEWMYRSVI